MVCTGSIVFARTFLRWFTNFAARLSVVVDACIPGIRFLLTPWRGVARPDALAQGPSGRDDAAPRHRARGHRAPQPRATGGGVLAHAPHRDLVVAAPDADPWEGGARGHAGPISAGYLWVLLVVDIRLDFLASLMLHSLCVTHMLLHFRMRCALRIPKDRCSTQAYRL